MISCDVKTLRLPAIESHQLPGETHHPLPKVVPISALGQGAEDGSRSYSHGKSSCFCANGHIRLNHLYLEEWLRAKSGINKKYFEGKAYDALRTAVKSSLRYARSDVKVVVCVHLSRYRSLTDHVW